VKRSALLVVALVVLAGCGGQTGAPTTESPQTTAPTDEPTQTTTDESTAAQQTLSQESHVEVSEVEGTLGGVNATKVWRRVGTIVSVDLPSPPDVVVLTKDSSARYTPSEFRASMGVEADTTSTTLPGGRYRPTGTVVIERTPNSTADQIESVLAHEFAHALQYHHLTTQFPDGEGLPEQTVIEGSAEYVEWEYAARYGSFEDERRYQRDFSEWPPIGKLAQARYYLGAKWVRNHSDPDAPLQSTYENQPTTAEQVLHGLEPGSERPLNLTVHGESGDIAGFDRASPERRGEAELRFLMEYGLSAENAAAAADGWGDDRLLRFSNASADGYAWVVRWDDPGESREFESLFADYRANVSEPVELRSVGDETTVILSGNAAFVRNATVSGTATNVTVTGGD